MKRMEEDALYQLIEKNGAVIYGGGRIGKNVYAMLEDRGCSPLMVWDKNAKNISRSVKAATEPIYGYENKKVPIIVSINSKSVYRSVSEELSERGFENIYWIKETENHQLCGFGDKFLGTKCNMCMVNRGGCKKYLDYLANGKKSILPIDEVTVMLTCSCSLSCKYCVQQTHKMKQNKISVKADQRNMEKSISHLVETIGWLRQISIVGGEVFLYKYWPQIVQSCLANDNIGIVRLLTNGICRINESEIPLLKNERIVIEIDDYGKKIPKDKRQLLENTKRLFDSHGINYSILDNTAGTWYNFGSFEKRGSAVEELKSKCGNCFMGGCMILDPEGYFTRCGRETTAELLGEPVHLKETERIKVLGYSVEELRLAINHLLSKEYLEMCDYCDGTEHIIPSGEQADDGFPKVQ